MRAINQNTHFLSNFSLVSFWAPQRIARRSQLTSSRRKPGRTVKITLQEAKPFPWQEKRSTFLILAPNKWTRGFLIWQRYVGLHLQSCPGTASVGLNTTNQQHNTLSWAAQLAWFYCFSFILAMPSHAHHGSQNIAWAPAAILQYKFPLVSICLIKLKL